MFVSHSFRMQRSPGFIPAEPTNHHPSLETMSSIHQNPRESSPKPAKKIKKHQILTSRVITDPRGIGSSVGCHVLAGLALSIEVDSLGGEIQQWKYLE